MVVSSLSLFFLLLLLLVHFLPISILLSLSILSLSSFFRLLSAFFLLINTYALGVHACVCVHSELTYLAYLASLACLAYLPACLPTSCVTRKIPWDTPIRHFMLCFFSPSVSFFTSLVLCIFLNIFFLEWEFVYLQTLCFVSVFFFCACVQASG